MRPKTHRANEWTRSVTSFCVCHGDFSPLTTLDSVLLVHNVSDAEMARTKGQQKEGGKPTGFGLPGGGMKGENFENPEEAARNELLDETGLRALSIKPFLIEFKGFKIDRTGDTAGKPFYFNKGQRPSIELGRGEQAVENHLHLFETVVNWSDSRLKKVFVERKKELLLQGATEDELNHGGVCVWLDELDDILTGFGIESDSNIDDVVAQKEIVEITPRIQSRARAALYIGIEEFDEIDGLAIIPLQTLLGEIYREEKPKPQDQRLFYTSHLRRLWKGFEAKGCLDKILGAA